MAANHTGTVAHRRSMGMVRNFVDGLANVVTGLGTRSDARTSRYYTPSAVTSQDIEAAYNGSPMLRKAVNIPATDRVRAWRDWQAPKPTIELIEAEERRHQIKAKARQCEILRGMGGAAMILVTAGDPALPIAPNLIAKGGLVAVNVVSRWHLSGMDWIEDLASPDYGKPQYWQISGGKGQQRLHPSRVVCFTGEPLPSIHVGSWDDRFWGRGRVPSLIEPAMNLDEALSSFAALIKDARNIDIGIPQLLDMVSTTDGEARIMKRLGLMSRGMSFIHANVYDAGDGEGKGGEKIDRHQTTWTGIPDMIRAYAESLSASADIPMTRFWGTSPKGLNATGEHDDQNWRMMIETGQELELRPCLDQIDAALVPSALGKVDASVWWKFGALNVPSEKAETERFKMWTEAAEKVRDSGAIPEIAFNKAYQNGLSENGWMPGMDGALEELSEEVRFGVPPEDDGTDPSALTQSGSGVEGGDPISRSAPGEREEAPPRRRLAANDKKDGEN